MRRPRVTLHSLVSLDGRLDGFQADVGLYYEVAAGMPHEAVLSGSGTILAAAAEQGVSAPDRDDAEPEVGDEEDPRPGSPDEEDPAPDVQEATEPRPPSDPRRPWLVVADSRGRLTRLDWLRSAPFWRDVIVLCAAATPGEHLDHLTRRGVAHHVVGTEQVDLRAALDLLAERYAVRQVRVDAGPTLSGALLRDGLVDEVSVVVAPRLVGGAGGRGLHLVEGLDAGPARRLALRGLEWLREDHVWLRYQVVSSS